MIVAFFGLFVNRKLRKLRKKIIMHRHAYAQAQARERAGRGAAGELPEVRNCRGAEALRSRSWRGLLSFGFWLLPFALLALYFTVFSAFSVFLDKFISSAAFFKNRRQFRALLALSVNQAERIAKKQAEHLPRLPAV